MPFVSLARTAAFLCAAALVPAASSHAAQSTTAVPASTFLRSIGANSAIATRGESLKKTIECVQYLGLGWLRTGIEGSVSIDDYIELHKQTGVLFGWSTGSGGSDLSRLLETGRKLAGAGALLAFEGPNEPNNWGITYKGKEGGRNGSWQAVAELQRDLYSAVKRDPVLKSYPVWSITCGGAETDNVGLQYLTIPHGAGTTMPEGTRYADFANVHNYVYHPNSPGLEDNKTWNASDPGPDCKVDGLFGQCGVTWAKHFQGYPIEQLQTTPRVTTETGCLIEGPVTEQIHALNLLSLYLAQFKRGWSYTSVYLLRDRVDEAGNQQFGFYKPDYTPRKAALYLHNLTTILADSGSVARPCRLDYSLPNAPATVHDLLLQKSTGTFELVVWSERLVGGDDVDIDLGRSFSTVRVYDPTVGTAPVQTIRDARTMNLTMTNHPYVIEVSAAR